MLMLVIESLSFCQASIVNRAEREKEQAYILSISGSRGKMTAQGTIGANSKCYTSLRNTYGSTIQSYVSVIEYDQTGSVLGSKSASNSALVSNAIVVTAGLARIPDDETRKYVHRAIVRDYYNPSRVVDELAYYIDQVD